LRWICKSGAPMTRMVIIILNCQVVQKFPPIWGEPDQCALQQSRPYLVTTRDEGTRVLSLDAAVD
jgi:hypothetical protein